MRTERQSTLPSLTTVAVPEAEARLEYLEGVRALSCSTVLLYITGMFS